MNTKHSAFKTRFFFMLILLTGLQGVTFAQPVSRETARQAAKTFLDKNGAQSSELADVSAAAGFAHLYVFTTDHSFVLMAADSRVQPVLGYSLDGGFDTEKMPDNKRAWIQEYSDGIQSAIERQTRASAEVTQQWQELVEGNFNRSGTVVVGPLVQTRWDQGSPYNLQCPSGTVTGCVATAMAQVMKYWNYPEHGIGSHSYLPGDHPEFGEQYADFNATYYDWNNMTNTYGSSSTSAQKQAVATLMYHCGVSVNMNYCPSSEGGSGAVTAFVAEALKTYFNYSSDVQHLDRSNYPNENEWIALLKAELDQRRPIQYHGSGTGGGHSFVCDGYRDDNYFHFNWGWSGYCDEYYTINNLNPGPGGIGSGSNGIYNNNQGAVIGIHPSGCTSSAPTNLTYTQSGRQVTLSWTAASGAASYNVYCNSNYVGNTATTSYTHSAPFGSAVYYVRSVDANGELSLSSNAVEVTVGFSTPVVDDLAATVDVHNVNLTWTAPEWCFPETETAIMSYGEGSPYYYIWNYVYFAHRYLAADLAQYANLAVYKVGTLIWYPGTYSVYVYGKTTNGQPDPNHLLASKEGVSVNIIQDWFEIDLDTPAIINGTDDLWVIIKQEDTGQDYPVPSFDYGSYDPNVCYAGFSPTVLGNAPESYQLSWFIRTYLTDGIYSYKLFRDGAVIANQIGDTQYTDSNLADGEYTYYVKTNYYGGETEASNTVTVTVPGLPTQTVALNEGWTWWSPTVETSLAELETALGDNGLIINSQDGGFARYEVVNGQGSWNGTLQGFVPGQMYKIAAQTAGTITLTGTSVTPSPISILHGYNWFGYTGVEGLTIAETLGGFEPAENDQIIGQEGTATYSDGAWSGSLTTLTRGKGYVYHSNDTSTKQIVF